MTYHGFIALDEHFNSPQGIHYEPNHTCIQLGQEWYDSIENLYKANPLARFYRIFEITSNVRIQTSPTTNCSHNITLGDELAVIIEPDPLPLQFIS